jgi:hypothetical protein
LTLYLYTFSLYENASLIIFSAETEYISTEVIHDREEEDEPESIKLEVEKPSRRIVIVEDMEESMEKKHQEQESK